MRLTSNEVKGLLARGRRETVRAASAALLSRSLDKIVPVVVEIGESDIRSSSNPSQSRIALSVPKRLLKRSVDRNRVKRVLRESFRQHKVRASGQDLLLTIASAPKSGAVTAKQMKRSWRQLADSLFNKLIVTKRAV